MEEGDNVEESEEIATTKPQYRSDAGTDLSLNYCKNFLGLLGSCTDRMSLSSSEDIFVVWRLSPQSPGRRVFMTFSVYLYCFIVLFCVYISYFYGMI